MDGNHWNETGVARIELHGVPESEIEAKVFEDLVSQGMPQSVAAEMAHDTARQMRQMRLGLENEAYRRELHLAHLNETITIQAKIIRWLGFSVVLGLLLPAAWLLVRVTR